MTTRNHKRNFVPRIIVAVFLAAGAAAPGCGRSSAGETKPIREKDQDDGQRSSAGEKVRHEEHEKTSVRLTVAQMKEFGVLVAVAGSGTITIRRDLTGEVQFDPNRVAHLVPSIGGVARRVSKQLGDRVRRGELMAVLASRELAQLNAAYLRARAERSLAWTEYQREKKLSKKGVTSAREFQRAELALSRASLALKMARRKLQALGFSRGDIRRLAKTSGRGMSRFELRAPFSGVVVAKHITRGEYLKADSQAFTVADLSKVWVVLKVYQKDLGLVHPGQAVQIEATYGSLRSQGTISYVSPIVDPASRTASARVVLDNPKGRWRPGLFVNGRVVVERIQVPLAVSRSAVQRQKGTYCVFVRQKDASFECRQVELGRGDRKHVEVLKGLDPGDVYAAQGGFTLKSQLNVSSFGDDHH